MSTELPISPHLRLPAELIDLLLQAAHETARDAYRSYRKARRPRQGGTLRPGTDTPLWNELMRLVRQQVCKRGEKVLLARELRLPRQRVHEFLKSTAAMPDAERTLELMGWLVRAMRRQAKAAAKAS